MALLVVLMCTTLLMALGGGLVMLTTTEARIAGHFQAGEQALYAAEAAIERVLPDLLAEQVWDRVLDGVSRSSFADGDPAGIRQLPDGTALDLGRAIHVERCGRPDPCTAQQMDTVTENRPSGPNNPRWQLYASGWLRDLAPEQQLRSRIYVVVWVGDDPLETDDDPLRDGSSSAGDGASVLLLRARAYAARGVHRAVEAVIARGSDRLRVVAWRQL